MGLLLLLSLPCFAQLNYMRAPTDAAPNTPPPILKNISVDQHLDAQVPLDLHFRDESGHDVTLGKYFGTRPVILNLVYYDCPMLCGEVLNGLTSALLAMKFDVGKEFEVVTVSFDPREKPPLAAAKKNIYIQRYGRKGAAEGWHFLTGEKPAIDALTQAVGFRYQFDPTTGQFAHATAIEVLTPQGHIAQYYYGLEYSPKDLRLGLIQASQNRIGTVVDQLLLYCYHYNPRTGKYGAIVTNILRASGAATVLILGGFIVFFLRHDPNKEGGRHS